MAGDAASQNVALINALATLPKTLFGSTNTVTTGGGGQTQQTMLSQEAVNALLKDLMENEGTGLAKVASGARTAGMYNTTSQQLMVNDLLARSAAAVAKASAPTVTTNQDKTQLTKTPGVMSSSMGLLGGGALILGTETGRNKLKELTGLDASSWFGNGGAAGGGASFISDAQALSSGATVSPVSYAGGGIVSAPLGVADVSGGGLELAFGGGGSDLGFAAVGDVSGGFGLEMIGAGSDASNVALTDWTSNAAGGAEFGLGEALPYLPAVMNLAEGDIGGAAGSGAGAYIGSAFGPVGTVVGSILGDAIFGEDGGCFITTAVCQAAGKDDNCYELEKLRAFRDTWLQENHPEDIKQYYTEAPVIVSRLAAREDAARIFYLFERNYIQPAIYALEDGDNEMAYAIYKSLFSIAKELANG